MAAVARSASGRAQLIPFVDLSLFALDIGDFERARAYVTKARSFDPVAYELYNLCVVKGLIAINAGRHREATQYLEKSIAACQIDECASLACGVRPPDLALVEKLLDGDHRAAVLRHLLDCKNVWQSLGPQTDLWINAIESGEKAHFRESGMLKAMNEPAFRLLMQYARARSLEDGRVQMPAHWGCRCLQLRSRHEGKTAGSIQTP